MFKFPKQVFLNSKSGFFGCFLLGYPKPFFFNYQNSFFLIPGIAVAFKY